MKAWEYFLYGGLTGLAIKEIQKHRGKMSTYGNPQSDSCPKPTQDLKLNTKNRNAAIREPWIQYGPLNLSDNKYWQRLAKHWKTTPAVAKKSRCANCVAFDISPRMIDCISAAQPSKQIEDADGYLGYCWMHHFKCHSARTCYTWAAGGPVTSDSVSMKWQAKSAK